MAAITLPIIDLQQTEDLHSPSSSLKNLLEASKLHGCFRVINHGIPPSLQSAMKSALRTLFDLPADVRRRNADVIHGSGYVGPTPTNPLYEAFGLYDAASVDDVEAFCANLDAPDHVRETIKTYSKRFHETLLNIAAKLSSNMGLVNLSFSDWPCQFRMNKYNFNEETVGSGGVQIHTDSGFMTLLQEDECVGGLEVLDETSGEWKRVDGVPGSLLVNLGDVAKAWSNGVLHNVKHRVQCEAAVPRFSIALFLLAPKDDKVETPMDLIDSEHPRLYKTFSYEEYRKLRVSTRLHAGEALDQMKIVR
ncbi:hypothetical protein LUZ60_016814 [Juncus effusus]|nr:hypothetical protein LUZ60_016814 [Juncus effusus]